MPHLRVLEVRFFELPPTTFMLPRLIHLRFVSPGTALSEILSFLRNTPSLQHLEVSDPSDPPESLDDETMGPSVELPNLSSLTYTTSDYQGTSVFRFLHYPPSTRVEFLSRSPPSDTPASVDDLASVLTRVEKSDAAATIEEISLTAVDDDFFHMQVSSHGGLMLGIYFTIDDGQTLPLLKLPTMLPCSGAWKLRIRGFHPVTVAYWTTFFTRHPQVRDLTAVQVHASFFRALLRPSENEPLPLRSVQHLLLSYCVIKKAKALLLKRVLEERTHLAKDIGFTLKIEDCRVGQNTIRELKAYAKVEWDGIERPGLEEDSEDDDGDEDSDKDSDDGEPAFISTAQ
ncbi:hypothetical protein EYR36_011977 [Pleurotus pulmonarius]|nr:hypothetical protein EYR36_011977 [Pleurotus pulmonarius]